MKAEPIAVVGMACRYPDARNPAELWENVVAQRQAFRRIPRERLNAADYHDDDPQTPDATYSFQAAVLTDYEFDRKAFRVSRPTFESTDLAHWLALEVAAAALGDAAVEADPASTGVIVGNTLTGDGSRASSLRLRWPYVRRVARPMLLPDELRQLERRFKEPFAEVTEDTLAGGLANTIAGRICNYFGFHGGGYTVDGACSSSLLAVGQACSALVAGDLDVALAGGVDLSLDPFELVGFAKCGALARDRMWVYDRKSNGFLPGEGCGFVVLMRQADALREGRRIYASILGWGISSDGHGGMTRPEAEGQRLALQRAYARAGIAIDSVALFEGHGTGTPVGDPIELQVLASSMTTREPHWIGSIKANIGHTKAAAGIAGLIKATLAVHHGVIPPVTGCSEPREELIEGPLRVAAEAIPWPDGGPRRAAVSAMGFGGINAHIVIEGVARTLLSVPPAHRQEGLCHTQDAELFLVPASLRESIAERAESMSLAELGDLATTLAREAAGDCVAVVASTPGELSTALRTACPRSKRAPRITLLFPGQAAPIRADAGVFGRRFGGLALDAPWRDKRFARARELGGTALAQPAIVAASLAGLRLLEHLGIEADCAIGHSLGELVALRWGGALDDESLMTLAFARGEAMKRCAGDGAMAALGCSAAVAEELCQDTVVAAMNGSEQTVIAGARSAVERVMATAHARGIAATLLPVAAAFHSPTMAGAASELREVLERISFQPLQRRVVSTIGHQHDLRRMLCDQLTHPVRFSDAIAQVADDTDLFIEVGPGRLLADLVTSKPVIALDVCGPSLRGLLECAAQVPAVRIDRLFADRFTRPFDLTRRPKFIESPCEKVAAAMPAAIEERHHQPVADDAKSVLRALIAQRAELPAEVVTDASRMLSELHLSSITVGRIIAEAARSLGAMPPVDPMLFANATIAEAAAALEELRARGVTPAPRIPNGVRDWTRPFVVTNVETPLPARGVSRGRDVVVTLDVHSYDECMGKLLDASRNLEGGDRFVVVQQRPYGSAFARTLKLERPDVDVAIINVPSFGNAGQWIAREGGGFVEATYDEDGRRYEPRVVPASFDGIAAPLTRDDVLLVSGGGKGIGAEAAIHLAKSTGARLVLIGRSRPEHDCELAANLERLRAIGAEFDYAAVDITDLARLREVIARWEPPTAILHAAGANEPMLIDAITPEAFRRVVAPKVDGLWNLIAAVDASTLRLLVTFGSVIARTGMRGEAHYAFANEWLAALTEDFGRAHPNCRSICIEWSVWAGLGMGERLGAMTSLREQGVTPLDTDAALRLLDRAIVSASNARLMITGRLGEPPTLRFAAAEPPPLRFLEHPVVSIPSVELIADSRISLSTDSYVEEHIVAGERLIPAVIGLEAMAQVASALRGERPRAFADVELRRPIVIPASGETTLRVAALNDDDRVELVVRSSETAFAVDHFRASVVASEQWSCEPVAIPSGTVVPAKDLYALLFHTGRFRRVAGYRALSATECIAEIDARDGGRWFHRYAPQELLLGDPAVRDAAIHALQACVPQSVVLPSTVERIDMLADFGDAKTLFVVALETSHTPDAFVYDMAIVDADGRTRERWRSLRLQVVSARDAATIPPSLWGIYLEREIGDAALRIVVAKDGATRASGAHVSSSHAGPMTMSVAHGAAIGCDLQAVISGLRPVLGDDSSLAGVAAAEAREPADVAATRVWSAREAMKKATGNGCPPLVLEDCGERGRVRFRAGRFRVETFLMSGHIAAIAIQS